MRLQTSMRFQILMDGHEMAAIREAARRRGITVSARARAALPEAHRADSVGDADRKPAAKRAADRCAYPTADIDAMLAEIDRGYGEAEEP